MYYFNAVYTQSLTEILQVVAGPMMQVLEEELKLSKRALKLAQERIQFLATRHSDTPENALK